MPGFRAAAGHSPLQIFEYIRGYFLRLPAQAAGLILSIFFSSHNLAIRRSIGPQSIFLSVVEIAYSSPASLISALAVTHTSTGLPSLDRRCV